MLKPFLLPISQCNIIRRADKVFSPTNFVLRTYVSEISRNGHIPDIDGKSADLLTTGDSNTVSNPRSLIESSPRTLSEERKEPKSNNYLGEEAMTDWSRSFFGLSSKPFAKEIADTLQAPVDPLDIEVKPEGLLYLPEIKYRRVLNKAFGPGGWGLAPRSETTVGSRIVSREYALVCLGRLVAIARGEQEFFDIVGIPTATEACKSNALMRCCKDLGIASELWDPRFIRAFKDKYCVEVFVENVTTKKK